MTNNITIYQSDNSERKVLNMHLKISKKRLKGKFSSGREGGPSIKIQLRFQIKTTIRSDVLHLFLKVFYVYLSKMYTETAKISIKRYFDF